MLCPICGFPLDNGLCWNCGYRADTNTLDPFSPGY